MKKEELKQCLINANIPANLYNLDGGLPNEAICLNKEGDFWEVYYSERGVKSQIEKFNTENDACNYLYKMLLELLGNWNSILDLAWHRHSISLTLINVKQLIFEWNGIA